MGRLLYALSCGLFRHACRSCLDTRYITPHFMHECGACLLAVTHLSHLEPPLISAAVRQPVHWLTRGEFYRSPIAAAFFRSHLTIPVDRFRASPSTFHRAIATIRRGGTVGILPEGGVAAGEASCLVGGPIKGGAALIALRSGVPIVPVAVYGADQLNCVRAWIPFGRKSPLVIAAGPPIAPPAPAPPRGERRAARHALTNRLAEAFTDLHARVRAAGVLDPVHERALPPRFCHV